MHKHNVQEMEIMQNSNQEDARRENIRVSFFRDFSDLSKKIRVLCIARQFDKEKGSVVFSCCINQPETTWKLTRETKNERLYVRSKGDLFSKAKARQIAIGRLEIGKSVKIAVAPGQKPIRACLEWLAENEMNANISRIAEFSINNFKKKDEL